MKTQRSTVEEKRLEQGDRLLEETKEKLEDFQDQLEKVKNELHEIERAPHVKIDESTTCLRELDILIREAEKNVAEITETRELKDKTDIVRKILSESHEQAGEMLRKYMVDETNRRIADLLTRDPIFLEDIGNSLEFKERAGASVGQTLSVSYAFLATLFNRSDYQLPFVVDSPAGALDLNIRSEIARLVPNLSKQFIAFTISSERQGFVDVLHEVSHRKIQYFTLFQKTTKTDKLWKNVDPSFVQETNNGVLVGGSEFFNRFDLDEEI